MPDPCDTNPHFVKHVASLNNMLLAMQKPNSKKIEDFVFWYLEPLFL